MESSGERLKKLRLEKGITIEEVHKKTRIHLDILRSIEEDNFININPVYLKGFLKIYCNFLGVNPADYLTEERVSSEAVKSSLKAEKPHRFFEPVMIRRPFLNKKIIFIIISIIVLVSLSMSWVSKKTKPLLRTKSLELKKPALVKVLKPKSSDKPAVKKQGSEALTVKVNGPRFYTQEQGKSGVRIGIRSLDDCWLQVKMDNRIIFQNVLKKGRFETWTAKDKIELALGSAGAVQLEINGKLIPPLGRKGQVLKNITITQKDGLKVGK